MKPFLKNISIVSTCVHLAMCLAPYSPAYAMEEDEHCAARISTARKPSWGDRLLAGIYASTPERFAEASSCTKFIFLLVAPVGVLAHLCHSELSGTSHCRINTQLSTYDHCRFQCSEGSLNLPMALAMHSSLRADTIDGNVVTTCSDVLYNKYDGNQGAKKRNQADKIRNQDEKARAKQALKDAEERESILQELEKALEKEAQAIKDEVKRASRSGSCSQPIGYSQKLPVPGSAADTCFDTTLRESADTCSYTTQCLDLAGKKKLNVVDVFKGNPDCKIDGTSTSLQENCNGKLRSRGFGESDAQCKDEKTAMAHAELR